MDSRVKEKFETYPDHVRPVMRELRNLILDVSQHTEGVGELEETLKWGEPAYRTCQSKSGTTIRIDWKAKMPEQCALYVNCKTTLVDTYRTLFPNLTCEGNRAIVLPLDEPLPENELRTCIQLALTYHVSK